MTALSVGAATSSVVEMSTEAGRAMLRGQVRDRLGITLDEFLDRVDRGDYDATDDDQVLRLVMLAPFAR